MIIKASQRGGGKQLGLHLLKTEENEHVEVHEVRGFVSEDVVGAMKEAYAVSRGTRCKQFLFSVSLNPPERESVGIDVFENAAERIEETTGLAGQPRVIVFHEKDGRRHAHVVWSRIQVDEMKAVNLAFFKDKLTRISRELYLENDWQMPRGLMQSEARDPRNFTLAEWQQAKRMGVHGRDLKTMMQECWAVSDSRAAFARALSERGLMLAKGDRRGHVAVTHDGEVLSVARYVGRKAKEVQARLGKPDELPGVAVAQEKQAQNMRAAFGRHVAEARMRHSQVEAAWEARRRDMTAAHAVERQKLDAAQTARWQQETRERQDRFNKGLHGLWDRITGKHKQLLRQNQMETLACLHRDRAQRDAIVSAQLQERQELQNEMRTERERRAALLIELRRERQQYRIAPVSNPEPKPKKPRSNPNTRQRDPVDRRREPRDRAKAQTPEAAVRQIERPNQIARSRAARAAVSQSESRLDPKPMTETFTQAASRREGPTAPATNQTQAPEPRRPAPSPSTDERLNALRRRADPQPRREPQGHTADKGPERD